MVSSKVTITMSGDLPHEAFSKKNKEDIEKRIEDSVIEQLGEYEIDGEFFGNDESVYALFYRKTALEEAGDGKDPNVEKISSLEKTVKSLQKKLTAAERERDEYKYRPEKYSLAELNIRYTALPFCEHCGENHSEYGVEIQDPSGGTAWCLDCFTTSYELCKQDVATIEKTLEKKEKAYYKRKAR